MMTFNSFIEKYKVKNQATTNKKIQQVVCSIGLNNVGIHLRDGPFRSDIGIINSHPTKGTHWVAYVTENFFDSYGCSLIEHSKIKQMNDQKMFHIQLSITIHIVNTNINELKRSRMSPKDPKRPQRKMS